MVFYQGSMSNHDKVYQNLVDVIQNNAVIAANSNDGLKMCRSLKRFMRLQRNSQPSINNNITG